MDAPLHDIESEAVTCQHVVGRSTLQPHVLLQLALQRRVDAADELTCRIQQLPAPGEQHGSVNMT